jgi:uncharacterized protein YbcI
MPSMSVSGAPMHGFPSSPSASHRAMIPSMSEHSGDPLDAGAATSQQSSQAGGRLNQAIADAVVQAYRRVLGRGPTRARAFYDQSVVVVSMHETLTHAERALVSDGRKAAVHEIRDQLQETMRAELVAAVEELTGRRVEAFTGATHLDPDLAFALFVLDRPVAGEPARGGDAPPA